MGIAGFVFFCVTGLLMDHWKLDDMSVDSAVRLLYRSRHIYLLFGSLVNVAVGLRFILPDSGPGSRMGVVASIMMLAAPIIFAFAFFLEPTKTGHSTFLCILGVFATYLGLLFYCLGSWRFRSV